MQVAVTDKFNFVIIGFRTPLYGLGSGLAHLLESRLISLPLAGRLPRLEDSAASLRVNSIQDSISDEHGYAHII